MHDDPLRTTALGLARYSHEFLEAALAVDERIGREPGYEIVAPIPALYLVGHSIELSLKAYLLHKGQTLQTLRRYDHNLRKCLQAAEALGLSTLLQFSSQEKGAFEILDVLYSTKQLEYIVTGPKHFPIFGPLETFAAKAFNTIAGVVGYPKRVDKFVNISSSSIFE